MRPYLIISRMTAGLGKRKPDNIMKKIDIYNDVAKQIAAVIEGETSVTARYATAACLLNEAFDYFFWTGFYVVDPLKPTELVVGPYQGIVKDVHEFPGHIACDSRSNSEIVVPVYDADGALAAVLDVDSTEIGSFDEDDKMGLEAICKTLLT